MAAADSDKEDDLVRIKNNYPKCECKMNAEDVL